jgi:hypothetical protein
MCILLNKGRVQQGFVCKCVCPWAALTAKQRKQVDDVAWMALIDVLVPPVVSPGQYDSSMAQRDGKGKAICPHSACSEKVDMPTQCMQ